MRSVHMIIQQMFLCLAAYEGYVLEISTLDIEQQLALVHINMWEVNVNYVGGWPMISSHITNKEVSKQKNTVSNGIHGYNNVNWLQYTQQVNIHDRFIICNTYVRYI